MSETERTYPALGASVWRVLLRNEWFKATRRLAFLVTFGLFAFIHSPKRSTCPSETRFDMPATVIRLAATHSTIPPYLMNWEGSESACRVSPNRCKTPIFMTQIRES